MQFPQEVLTGGILGRQPDPGATGQIKPIGGLSIILLESAGAETRTIAPPGADDPIGGRFILLHMLADGGDITLTFPAAANETGNNTAVFADRGDWLIAYNGVLNNSTTPAWRVIASNGATLSTV